MKKTRGKKSRDTVPLTFVLLRSLSFKHETAALRTRGGKNSGLKKNQPSGFFGGFFGFFGFFFGFFCPEERVFWGFFSFTNTFGCIQTLNYNHSY